MKNSLVFLAPGGIGGVATQVELFNQTTSDLGFDAYLFKTTEAQGVRSIFQLWRLVPFARLLSSKKPDVCYIPLASKGSFYRKFLYSLVARLYSVPYVIHVHGGGFADFFYSQTTLGKRFMKLLFQKSMHVFLLHSGQTAMVSEILGTLATSKVSILPNGVNIKNEGINYNSPKSDEAVRGIFIGDVTLRKGIGSLLNLNSYFARVNVKFEIVGKIHPDVKVLLSRHTKNSLGNFAFLGALSHDEAMSRLERAHFLVLPSKIENFPNVILEAFSHGVPVMATDVGAIAEMIENGKNGWLLSSIVEAEAELMRATDLLVSQKRSLDTYSFNAKLRAEKKYNIKVVVRQLLAEIGFD